MGGLLSKRIITLILCITLCFSILTNLIGCTSDNNQQTTVGEQKDRAEDGVVSSNQEKPVKILSEITGGKDPDEHEMWIKEAERLSGIQLDITKASGSEYSTKLTTTLASGDDYDIVYMLSSDFEKLFKLGMFEPIYSRIQESDILGNPEIIDQKEWDRIKREDGEVYGVFSKYEGGRLPIVRFDWMQKLGITEPKNLDDYYEMLKAFTFNDPDGNGKKDTYGLTMKNIYDIQPFMSTKGLYDGYAQDEEGNWYMPYATQEAAEIYDWLAKLYKEGILDPNFATNSSSNCREMILSNRAGMMVYWDGWVGLFNEKAKAADPDSPFEMKGLVPPLDQNGNATITAGQDGLWVMLSQSNNKDYAFKFLEFMHTNEGSLLMSLGIEGYDYEAVDGQYILTEIGEQHAMDHGTVNPKSLQWQNPVKVPMNFPEAKEIVMQFSKPEVLRDTSKAAKEIVIKYAVKAIMGATTGEEAVLEMQKELKSKDYID